MFEIEREEREREREREMVEEREIDSFFPSLRAYMPS